MVVSRHVKGLDGRSVLGGRWWVRLRVRARGLWRVGWWVVRLVRGEGVAGLTGLGRWRGRGGRGGCLVSVRRGLEGLGRFPCVVGGRLERMERGWAVVESSGGEG